MNAPKLVTKATLSAVFCATALTCLTSLTALGGGESTSVGGAAPLPPAEMMVTESRGPQPTSVGVRPVGSALRETAASLQSVRPLLPIDQDPACGQTCGSEAGTADAALTIEEVAVIQELVRSYVRMQVLMGRITVWWQPETMGDIIWMDPHDWHPMRPAVQFCTNKMWVYGWNGQREAWACAVGISSQDRIVVSLAEPDRVRALVFWETTNFWLAWKLGAYAMADGSFVGETTNWGMQTIDAMAKSR